MFKTMKIFITVFCTAAFCLAAFAQEAAVDRIAVPFSDPSRPGRVEAHLINGSISIEGYDGKEVMIEARNRSNVLQREQNKSSGMIQLKVVSTGLEVEEQNNEMSISAETAFRTVDLNIKVPKATSLTVNTVNNGDVFIKNIQGEIEVSNVNGEIKALDISGAVLSNTTNGDVKVTFNKITPDKPMSFVSFNGDVDVTFPGEIKADVKLKTEHGEIFSDYDVQLVEKAKMIKKDTRKEGGKYHLKMESTMYGKINGGGPEYHFSTFNGRIYIRKGK